MTSERLQREEQFHSKNFFLEMPRSPAKMRLKSAPQKLNFQLRIIVYINAATILRKTILCETNNIFYSKRY